MNNQSLTPVELSEMQLGVNIRTLRQRHSLTQAELAERANISLSAHKYLESGKGSSLATLIRVARALDRATWLEEFLPAEPEVSPIAILRARQKRSQGETRRVRHRRDAPFVP